MRKQNSQTRLTSRNTGGLKDKVLTGAIQQGIATILSKKGGSENKWIGSMSELDRALRRVISIRTIESWPGSPSAMRVALNNAVYYIRRSGIKVDFSRTSDHSRKRVVEFVRR